MLLAKLTPEQKIWLLEQADQRERLTDKALAALLGVSVRTVNSALVKLRKARREQIVVKVSGRGSPTESSP